jgi:hypothetical protein
MSPVLKASKISRVIFIISVSLFESSIESSSIYQEEGSREIEREYHKNRESRYFIEYLTIRLLFILASLSL